MTKKKWTEKIKAACIGVGTYRVEFEQVIEDLADILALRDDCKERYESQDDPQPILYYPNGTFGKSPLLTLADDYNKTALTYWRDLGLTPAGLKKIDEKALSTKKKSGFGEVVADLFNDK